MKRITPEDNEPMSLRDCLIATIAAMPTHEDGHPTTAERDALLADLRDEPTPERTAE